MQKQSSYEEKPSFPVPLRNKSDEGPKISIDLKNIIITTACRKDNASYEERSGHLYRTSS